MGEEKKKPTKYPNCLRVQRCNSKPLRDRDKMDAVGIFHDSAVTVSLTSGGKKHVDLCNNRRMLILIHAFFYENIVQYLLKCLIPLYLSL